VWSASIVEVEPAGEGWAAFVAGAVDRAVGPAAEHRADETFRLSVRARPVGPGAEVFEAERLAGERVDRGAVRVAVVGHQSLNADPESGEVRDRATQEGDRGRGFLVLEHLDVGEPGRVVDRNMHELPADPAATQTAIAMDAMADLSDPSELLDIDVDELARPPLLVRLAASSGSSRQSFPSPIRVKIPETVETGIPSVSAISAPVIRSRRSPAIIATRASSVRAGTEAGAEQRSNRPCPPSTLRRRSHFETVRTLTPAASAAAAIVHPSRSTRSTARRRLCGQVPALACNFIRNTLLGAGRLAAPASKEARMEQRSEELQLGRLRSRNDVTAEVLAESGVSRVSPERSCFGTHGVRPRRRADRLTSGDPGQKAIAVRCDECGRIADDRAKAWAGVLL
jgi:hypothetical protein